MRMDGERRISRIERTGEHRDENMRHFDKLRAGRRHRLCMGCKIQATLLRARGRATSLTEPFFLK